MNLPFKLTDGFINNYTNTDPDFGYNGLGLLTYYRTYSRLKEDGNSEQWFETVRRVVEGCYSLQKEYILNNDLGWNDNKAQKSAREMYDRMFKMKFLPPGRMLWAMGTSIIHEKKVGQALFNCAFVSTEQMGSSIEDAIRPFTFMMDMSMVGVGVGFDVLGAQTIQVHKPKKEKETYVIPDTREGWVESIKKLLTSYFSRHFSASNSNIIQFDYSKIRPEGEPIRGFGGVSSGPAPLEFLHKQIRLTLNQQNNKYITLTAIADLMNMIGQCVVAGNVRRTAQIALGDVNSEEYRKLKDYNWDNKKQEYTGSMAHRAAYGWASNNSVMVDNRTNFQEVARQTAVNGEPGYIFMDNIRAFSRMCDPADFKDIKARGTNPCGEQSLESYELCCLVETFPSRAESREDYLRTLKFAYMVGKTATLVSTTWHQTNRVQKRNRRIGTSVTGITNFIENHSLDTLKNWLEKGYSEIQKWDDIYSSWLCVPRSIKTTSVKPSGTVSLLAGVNPGCHYPEFKYYIRRVRIAKNSALIPSLLEAGLDIEQDKMDPSSSVVSFPVHNEGKTLENVSIWEQVSLAAFLQTYWSDNQVSCTVTFKPEEAGQIAPVLDFFKYTLKSISFLPKIEMGAYAQMPYEGITREKYEELINKMKPIKILNTKEDVAAELFCNNEACVV